MVVCGRLIEKVMSEVNVFYVINVSKFELPLPWKPCDQEMSNEREYEYDKMHTLKIVHHYPPRYRFGGTPFVDGHTTFEQSRTSTHRK